MVMSAEEYVESLYPVDPMLEKVKEGIRGKGMPEISIAPGYGRLLTLLVHASGAKNILEIGALGGYSGICLARGLGSREGRLTSLELDAHFAETAHQHLEEAGLGDKVTYRIGAALDSLEQLSRENARFDFFFIDADKENYPTYLDWALKLANPGAIIAGDNALQHGRAADPAEDTPAVAAMREFNRRMATDPRLFSAALPAYDGLALASVR